MRRNQHGNKIDTNHCKTILTDIEHECVNTPLLLIRPRLKYPSYSAEVTTAHLITQDLSPGGREVGAEGIFGSSKRGCQ